MPAKLKRIKEQLNGVAAQSVEPDTFCAIADQIIRQEISYSFSAWATVDPFTMIATRGMLFPVMIHSAAREREIFRREALGNDVLMFSKLAVSDLAGSTYNATEGHPRESPRFRALSVPIGAVDELRVALADRGECWGHITAYRLGNSKPFSIEEIRLARSLAPTLGAALRVSLLNCVTRAQSKIDLPGWLLLDHNDEIVASDPTGDRWLQHLSTPEQTPILLRSLASTIRARNEGQSIKIPTQASGWVTLHGSRANGLASDAIAIIIEPKRHADTHTHMLDHELTAREQQVANGVLSGKSTKELASELAISVWTVQDHLKAVFVKFDVHSRAELASRLFSSGQTTSASPKLIRSGDDGLLHPR